MLTMNQETVFVNSNAHVKLYTRVGLNVGCWRLGKAHGKMAVTFSPEVKGSKRTFGTHPGKLSREEPLMRKDFKSRFSKSPGRG